MWTLETRLRYERRRGYDARWWELLSRFGKSWWYACPFLKFWIVFRKTTSYSSWVKLRRHELNCKWRNGHHCRLNAENADWSWPFDQSGRRIQSNQSEVRCYWPMKSLCHSFKKLLSRRQFSRRRQHCRRSNCRPMPAVTSDEFFLIN